MWNGAWGMEYGESPTITEEGCRASLTDAGQGEREVLGDVEGVDGPAKVQQPTLQCQQQPQVHVQPARASLPAARGGRGLAQSPVSTAMPAPARPAPARPAARLTFRAVPSSRLFFLCRCPPGSAPFSAPCRCPPGSAPFSAPCRCPPGSAPSPAPCRCPPGSAPSPAPCCRLLTFSMDVYGLSYQTHYCGAEDKGQIYIDDVR